MNKGSVAVVLGMHRSGTSAVAEFVNSLGYALPGDELDTSSEINQRGFWESKQIVDFNESLLSSMDMEWYSLREFHDWDVVDDSIWSGMVDWLKVQIDLFDRIVIKDPRINILLPIWQRIFSQLDAEIFYVNVNRHPDYVVQSLAKRDGFPHRASYLLWQKYVIKPIEYLSDGRCFFINYEDLINQGQIKLMELAEYLDSSGKGDISVIDHNLSRNINYLECDSAIATASRSVYRQLSAFDGSTYINKVNSSNLFEESKLYRVDDESLAVMDDLLNDLVLSRKQMIKNGRLYSEAVKVISEKDGGLEENRIYIADLNKTISAYKDGILNIFDQIKIWDNSFLKDYFSGFVNNNLDDFMTHDAALSKLYEFFEIIKRLCDGYVGCQYQVANLESVISSMSSEIDDNCKAKLHNERYISDCHDRIDYLHAVIEEKELEAHHNISYIEKCNYEIARLSEVIRVKNLGEEFNKNYIEECHRRISDLHSIIDQKDNDAQHNVSYIEKCHQEIARLCTVLREKELGEERNKNFIASCNEEIARLMSVIAFKEDGELRNRDYIESCHARIAELDQELSRSANFIESLKKAMLEKEHGLERCLNINNTLKLKLHRLRSDYVKVKKDYQLYSEFVSSLISSIPSDLLADGIDQDVVSVFDNIGHAFSSLVNQRIDLNRQLNYVVTEFSLLTIKSRKMQLSIDALTNHKWLSKFNNKILNGL